MLSPRALLIAALLAGIVIYFIYRIYHNRRQQSEFEQSLESTRAQLESFKQAHRKQKKAKK